MFRITIGVAVAALLWAGAARAESELHYGPAPGWVRAIDIPDKTPAPVGAPLQLLLQERQSFHGPDGDETYARSAIRILNAQGLSTLPALSFSWNPETETATVVHLTIWRDGKPSDAFADGKKMLVIRRETNLERAMLDGALTASFQPEGLRVGDVVEFAITLKRQDPVYQGRHEGYTAANRGGVIGRFYDRELWPAAAPVRWRGAPELGQAKAGGVGAEREVVFDRSGFEPSPAPRGAPARFRHPPEMTLTSFSDWAEVSTLMEPLYRKASTLPEGSPLKTEAAKIRAAYADPKARAAAALRLVQEQIRYLFLGMNLGGYTPADADTTWSRRFGDCKGKTALLLALLHELGIEAEPALVATEVGDGLDGQLPRLGVFDHVLVRATVDGKVYWLDGTRLNDRGLDDLKPPPFHWALPVRAREAALEALKPPPMERPEMDDRLVVDASAGVHAAAPARIELTARGETGIALRQAYNARSQADSERVLRESWARTYPWIKIDKTGFGYDEATGEMKIWASGVATLEWLRNGGLDELVIAGSSLGWSTSYDREPGPQQDAPYAVAYPSFQRHEVAITLPKAGDFTVGGAPDLNRVLAGYELKRRSQIDANRLTVETSQKAVSEEVPAETARRDAVELRAIAQSQVVLRTGAAPTATETAAAAPRTTGPPSAPRTAAEFANAGVQALYAGQLDKAVAAFDGAAKLEPTSPKHPYNRGVAHFQAGDMARARADFNQALKLKPDHVLALSGRAETYLAAGDVAAAERDFAAAIKAAPTDTALPLRRAEAYARVRRYDTAVEAYDQLLAKQPSARLYGQLLADRCRAIAQWGQKLERGLADCDSALADGGDRLAVREARALTRLRLGQPDQAIEDFDAILNERPKDSRALFGRGLAELRAGRADQGKADLDEAARLDGKVAADFAGYGLRP